jgi:ribosomal protein S27AE
MQNEIYRADRAVVSNPTALRCPNDTDHGKMFPDSSGSRLTCGKCGTTAPFNMAFPETLAALEE